MTNTFYINNTEFILETEIKDKLHIKSHPEDYIAKFEKFENKFDSKQVVLVDKNVQELYNINHDKMIVVEANEQNKSIETVLDVCETLTQYGFDKGFTLVVIGGGIIQDIGAFTSKIYKRGINWIFYPTTLLSQCDSCIGGKTALNFKSYKNQLALFSAPQEVIIDVNFLNTLSPDDIISGYGEIAKLFLIGGDYYINNIDKFNYKEAIYHSLSIKKVVVDWDEFEINERKSLNYGHSFGHVIEPMTNYKIPHGEAVLLGIEIINKLFTNNHIITNLINKYTSLDKIKNLDPNQIINNLKSDKKVKNGIITFVVTNPGVTYFLDTEINTSLENKINEILVS
jgi:3-dehydroquinate synthase